MDFIKKLFNDDDKVIGLCSFKKKPLVIHSFNTEFGSDEILFGTNIRNNFLLS